MSKPVNVTNQSECPQGTEFFGADAFLLIAKASNQKQGWVKSTKAMCCGRDVVIQSTTQLRNEDGTYSIAEALTTVNDASIVEHLKDGEVVGRQVVKLGVAVQLENQDSTRFRAVRGDEPWTI